MRAIKKINREPLVMKQQREFFVLLVTEVEKRSENVRDLFENISLYVSMATYSNEYNNCQCAWIQPVLCTESYLSHHYHRLLSPL